MKNRIIFIVVIICCVGSTLYSQTYFNRHFKIDSSNLTTNNLLSYNNKLLCTYLNFDSTGELQSGIAMYNQENDILTYHHFSDQRIALDGVYLINNKMVLFGKKESSLNGLNYLRVNLDSFQTLEEEMYSTFFDTSFPYGGVMVNGELYQGYSDKYFNIDHKEVGVIKLDVFGNKIWQRNYNQHITRNSIRGVNAFSDGRIVLSAGIWRAEEHERVPQALLLDPATGDILDSVYSETHTVQFDSGIYSEVLNNNVLVQAYKEETVIGTPVRMDFYNSDLELLNTRWIQSTEPLRISPLKIIKGRGDYFFMVGYYTDYWEDVQYGYISKISNSGSVIWRHHYRHPDYLGENTLYSIQDIIEEENGDITCMGAVFPLPAQKELWLFKINEHGCFGGSECEEEVITSTRTTAKIPTDIIVYPNPVKDILYVESQDIAITTLTIYDMRGMLLSTHTITPGHEEVNVESLPCGTYALKILDRDGKAYGRIFLKE